MCCGTTTMCASCKNGNITPPSACVAEHRPCVQVARTVTSPPHPMCCGTSTMCASCKNGSITPPTPCVAEHPPCVQVARTVTSPPPPHVSTYAKITNSTGSLMTPVAKTLLHICKNFCEYTLHLLGWNFSLAFLVSELSPPSHLHLPSISFQRLLERSSGPTPKHLSTCPTPLMSQKSRTPLVHHFTPFSFTVSRPGATDPRAKHQALAPSVPISFQPKSMFVNVLLTFNASAMACGELTRRSATTCKYKEIKVNFSWKDAVTSATCRVYLSLFIYTFKNAPPIPLPSCFHPMFPCEGLLERSSGPTPKHQSTNTANVSEVSNTTGTPLYSIFVHRFEAWSHRPPSQAPGLCSFLANPIRWQVDVRNRTVDF